MKLKRGGPIAIGVIFTTIVIDFMGYLILVPVLPGHLAGLGADPTDQGWIIGLYMFVLVLALPIWGWIGDRLGRRPVLVTCLLGTSLSFALMASAESLWLFYVARVLQGIFGASVGAAQAYISDLTSEEDRARGFGLIGAAGSLGLFCGPALGGMLYGISPSLAFQVPSFLALVAFAGAALFLPESRGPDFENATWSALLRSSVPAPLLILFGVHQTRTLLYLYLFFHIFVAFGAAEAMFANYTREIFGWTPRQSGFFLTFIAVVSGLTQGFLIPRLIGLFGERSLVSAGLALAAAAMLAIAGLHEVAALLLAGFVLAVGFGLVVPTFTSMFSKACGNDETGAYHAHSQAMLSLGRGVGALLGGMLTKQINVAAPFFVGGLALVGGLAIFALALPMLRVDTARRDGEPAAGAP
jgi:DHA1 family tetracycline resistance protein-like MFS transporter